MATARVDGEAVLRAERQSVLAMLGAGRTPAAVEAIARDAQEHADWLVEGAKGIIPPGAIACREGCAFCCHLHVITTIPEVLRIADQLRAALDASGLAALRRRIAAHRAATAGRSVEGLRRLRAACPLLEGGRCSVYPIRPMSCRGWNSLDVGGCESHYRDPSGHARVPVYGPQRDINAYVQEGMVEGLGAAGVEGHRVELVAALEVALDVPDAAARWLANEPIFRAARA